VNVYVESNFVLELAFAQEQSESFQQILSLGESDKILLVLPGYCLAEPLEKLNRQERSRAELQRHLDGEVRQLLGTSSYKTRIRHSETLGTKQ
jgi:hypothetical protein